jgi:hypothetical protein
MKTLSKRTAWLGISLVVAGCQAPLATGRRGLSASEQSGAFVQGDSGSGDSGNSSADSGNSSGNSNSDSGNSSGDSKSDSGNSSGDSGNSSADSRNSSADSGNSSDGSKSDSGNSSDSKSNSDGSSDSSGNSSNSSQKNPAASATVVGLTAVGLGVVFWQVAEHAARAAPVAAPPPQELAPAAQTYLRARAHQLREDLALGAGPTVEELAALARIRREHLGAFGQLLRAHRQELLALADVRTLTPERALSWLRRVGELARTDSRLEDDRSAFLAAYGGEETRP